MEGYVCAFNVSDTNGRCEINKLLENYLLSFVSMSVMLVNKL